MNKKGVTLLELIIVMVIIAIGATLMVPAIGSWIPHYRLRSATRDIVSTMRTAQMKAVSNNLQYRVSFNPEDLANLGPNAYILQRNSGEWTNDGEIQTLPPGITIVRNTLPGLRATFNPDSTASSGSVSLRNTKGTERRIVVTAATGRIRIEE